jgi:hypothetical protein
MQTYGFKEYIKSQGRYPKKLTPRHIFKLSKLKTEKTSSKQLVGNDTSL